MPWAAVSEMAFELEAGSALVPALGLPRSSWAMLLREPAAMFLAMADLSELKVPGEPA